jgi:hypothetical protein
MIQAYVGLPGTGKTLAMVKDCIPLLKNGIKVYSNFPVRWGKQKDGKFRYSTITLNPVDFMDAVQFEDNATFLVDECNVVFSSYDDAKKIDRGLLNRFAQGRKLNLDFYFTSQRFTHSLKRIRDLTNVVIDCKKMRIFGFTFFRHIYYNPTIFDREALFDTPMETKYILKKRFIPPWELGYLYNKYPTDFIIKSKDEWIRKDDKPKVFKEITII